MKTAWGRRGVNFYRSAFFKQYVVKVDWGFKSRNNLCQAIGKGFTSPHSSLNSSTCTLGWSYSLLILRALEITSRTISLCNRGSFEWFWSPLTGWHKPMASIRNRIKMGTLSWKFLSIIDFQRMWCEIWLGSQKQKPTWWGYREGRPQLRRIVEYIATHI